MDEVRYWLDEIKEAKKREKDFRKNGDKILKTYQGEKTPFNILYSNTETLLPALFSDLPKPVITRRFKDDDPLGKIAAEAGTRCLEYLLDTDIDEYDSFSDAMEDVTLDGLLPGRGNCSVKYESDDDVTWETVCPDVRDWKRVYYGYAKKWSRVPWVAYEEYLDEDECKDLFPEKVGDLVFMEGEEEEDEKREEKKGKKKTALIYQIWVKKDRTIKYISPQYKEGVLKEDEDPLSLTGFFNCPKPVQFVKKPSDLVPTALYTLYENQAEELNKIQGRINKMVDAIKARGIYAGNLGEELENMFAEADNAFVPTDDTGSLMDGGLDKSIWFWPVDKLIIVLQQLYQARESCKSVIYEITGISDIVRGQSVASETLGAQKIKESWGTMRLKRLQKEVQRYALDVMKLMLEVASTKFSEETWKKMTMLPYPTKKEKEKAQGQLKAMQEQHQQQVMTAQQQGMQPEPFEPPQELVQAAQSPSWAEIIDVLQDDFQRSYRLDIETNSTLDVEATEDKQMVGEFMNALGQVMAGLSNSPDIPFEAKKSIILAVMKRFRFGREVEDELKSMKQQQPQIPPQIQQQIQQQQKQIEQGQQQIQKEQEKIRQEEQKLEVEKQQLKFEREMAKLEQKHREDLMKMKDEMEKTTIVTEIESIMQKEQQKLQSLVDKSISRIEQTYKKVS